MSGPAHSLCWRAAVPHRTQPKPQVLLQLFSVDGLQCLYRDDAVAADHLQQQGPTRSAKQSSTPGKGVCTGDARGTSVYVQGSRSCSCFVPAGACSALPLGAAHARRGATTPAGNTGWQRCTHHHADVCLGFHVDRLVQHNIHELVKTTQRPRYMPIGIEDDCRTEQQRRRRHSRVCGSWAPASRQDCISCWRALLTGQLLVHELLKLRRLDLGHSG